MELKAGRAHIRLDPAHGGRLASLQIDGREVLVTESDDPRGWGAYPMVPWAGRVRSGRFAWREAVSKASYESRSIVALLEETRARFRTCQLCKS